NDTINTISPWHLEHVLDLYSVANSVTHCDRAIVCISASIPGVNKSIGWTLADYERHINSWSGNHHVSHTISLVAQGVGGVLANLINIHSAGPNQIAIAGAPNPPNLVAESARRFIGLV
ncbi:MAG: hypothetical protein RIR04_784, partial [Pseudomonadota bacterium]